MGKAMSADSISVNLPTFSTFFFLDEKESSKEKIKAVLNFRAFYRSDCHPQPKLLPTSHRSQGLLSAGHTQQSLP